MRKRETGGEYGRNIGHSLDGRGGNKSYVVYEIDEKKKEKKGLTDCVY